MSQQQAQPAPGVLLGDAEKLALRAAAALLIGGVLVGIASTPFYAVAIGMEVVALFYVLAGTLGNSISSFGALQAFTNFLSHPTGGK